MERRSFLSSLLALSAPSWARAPRALPGPQPEKSTALVPVSPKFEEFKGGKLRIGIVLQGFQLQARRQERTLWVGTIA